ncbi:cyanobactin maturation protease PatG family protein [Geodermatophilus sp. SYSU D00698]
MVSNVEGSSNYAETVQEVTTAPTRASESRGPNLPNPTEDRNDGQTGEAGLSFVYAIGEIEPRFPSLSLEREFAQVAGRRDTHGLSDRQTLNAVLSERSNRYLVRQLCWVFSVERLPTYLLIPRDPADLDLLVESLDRNTSGVDLDVVIGVRGPLASPETCNGLIVPMVAFDQVYSFERDDLIQAIPVPQDVGDSEADEASFRDSARELFDRIMQMADNAGATDEHRALNYLAVRYPAVYAQAAEANRQGKGMTAVEVRPSRLSGAQVIVDVIFSFTHRRTDVSEKFFVRVDVSGEFPFLISKMQPYYER